MKDAPGWTPGANQGVYMSASYTEWYVQLIDGRISGSGQSAYINDSTGFFDVLTAGDPARITCYSDERGTALTTPGTMTAGVIQFWTQSSVTSVDLTIETTQGHAFFVQSLIPSNHRVVVMPEKIEQVLILPYNLVGASEVIVNTGFRQHANMLIKDVFLHVTTVGTGAMIDIGTSTKQSGFAIAVTVDTTGFPLALLNEKLTSASQVGSYLALSGTASYARSLHQRLNATSDGSIVYSNTTSSSTAGAGYIYIIYYRIPA